MLIMTSCMFIRNKYKHQTFYCLLYRSKFKGGGFQNCFLCTEAVYDNGHIISGCQIGLIRQGLGWIMSRYGCLMLKFIILCEKIFAHIFTKQNFRELYMLSENVHPNFIDYTFNFLSVFSCQILYRYCTWSCTYCTLGKLIFLKLMV